MAIEFTSPQSAVENILLCFDAGVPVVCGTTGWLAQMDMVQKNAKKTMELFYTPVISALA